MFNLTESDLLVVQQIIEENRNFDYFNVNHRIFISGQLTRIGVLNSSKNNNHKISSLNFSFH